MATLDLPRNGAIETYTTTGTPVPLAKRNAADFPRIAYGAAHVVADPLADNDPWLTPAIDWDRTLAFRHRLWDLGLGVAEAMDTAQRGMGLGWPEAQELIRRALAEAKGRPGALIACGAGTDHLDALAGRDHRRRAPRLRGADRMVEAAGGRIILMASRALAAAAKSPDDYLRVYDRILSQVKRAGDHPLARRDVRPGARPATGATPTTSTAMDTCLAAIEANAAKVDGIKVSLLSKEKEIAMRRRLPEGVRMYTGDDFNYAELIAGDEDGHSDALLGIFDAIAPVASAALEALGRGSDNEFFDLLEPTVPLSRHIFKAPTRFYKTGVVFLAYLNGLQDHFVMVGGQQSARSLQHLAELFRLADQARVLADPDEAAVRMKRVLAVHGLA